MTEEKRTLIETYLPVEEISEEAKKEKNGRARTFEMQYWWTRKPLIASKAAVLGALLPSDYDISKYIKLLGLRNDKRSYKYDLDLKTIESLKKDYIDAWGPDEKVVLDPFSGGGSIPFEAMRLGIDTISNDYNPLAHIIQKTTLEFPRKYGKKLYKDVEKGMDWVINETQLALEEYYPSHMGKDVKAYIWGWVVRCPKCGHENPLVGQWWLARTSKNHTYIEPSISDNQIRFEIKKGDKAPEGNCNAGKGKCLNPACGATIEKEAVKKDIFEREKEILIAVVLSGNKKKEYSLPSNDDIESFEKAKTIISQKWNEFVVKDLVPLEEIPEDNRGALWAKLYLNEWHRLLNPRQKLVFITLVEKIKEYTAQIQGIHDEEYAHAISLYISLIIGKHIDRNCRSTAWDRTREIIAHALSYRGIPMMWDHTEVNPFIKGSGTLLKAKKSVLDGLEFSINSLADRGNAETSLKSITHLDKKAKIIVCDPPYFDDVQYAELSEFMYVWERKALSDVYDFGVIPKSEDLSVGGTRTQEYFSRLFYISCKKLNEILHEEGILVMFFAHSSIEAWDFVINSMQKTGFKITATWPVHTENPNNPLARGNASIMSSIIIVARKRKSDKSGFIEEIQDEVEQHLSKRLEEFWNYGLRGADVTVSAMGATLDVITQYSEINSYTGEMKVKDILELVQQYVSQYVLSKYIENPSGLDGQTSFYLYSRLSGLDGMPFDTANLVSKSLNVNLKQFESDGIIKSSKSGRSKGVKILKYSEREVNKKQSLIDVVHYILIVFERSGISDVIKEMDESPFSRDEISNVLEAMLSLPAEDVERKAAQRIVDQMGRYTPSKTGQRSIVDDF